MKPYPRILVVEDDEEVRKILCEQLVRADYTVQGVCDGIEALMELEDRPWDVVLTDFKMPRLNGLDLLGVITACWPNTPVVMLSGESPDTAKLVLKLGAFAWVRKPYDQAHLLHMVRMAVQRALELRAQMEYGLSKSRGQ